MKTRLHGLPLARHFAMCLPLALAWSVAAAEPAQWQIADGGNGHWYDAIVVGRGITWYDADTAAQALGGHLATLTAKEESDFVLSLVPDPVWAPPNQGGNRHGPWLGGLQLPSSAEPGEGWRWVTHPSEPWQDPRVDIDGWGWNGTQPNNSGGRQDRLHLYINAAGSVGWNDMEGDFMTPGQEIPSFVVEWGTTPPPFSPTLSWSGESGFECDGVDPDVGTPGQTLFRYRVKLTDPDGDEPDYVRVIIWKDGARYLNRRMRPVRGAGPTSSGRVYKFSLRDPLPPGTYQYRFRARDDDGFASGPPTEWQSGPSMLPELLFGTAPGVENGVRPNTGTADDTVFLWKVIYRDGDGDPAKFVRVLLWRDGSFYNVFRMVDQDPEPDPKAGVVYRARRGLPAGSYGFRFEAEDKDGRAVGPASVKMSGLTVTAAAPLALTSLSAAPTNAGVQITFSLSSAAQVQARVLNIAGRPIRTLCHAKDCEAGTNTLVWNAQSHQGLSVPNGTYLVEVTAKGPDGSEARGLSQVRVSR